MHMTDNDFRIGSLMEEVYLYILLSNSIFFFKDVESAMASSCRQHCTALSALYPFTELRL